MGPDGTAASFYDVPAAPLWFGLNGKSFIRYRAYLATTDPAVTPDVTNVRVSWDRRPAPPTNLQPAGTTTATPTFTWTATDADSDALTYLFQLATDATFTTIIENRVRLRDPTHTLAAPLDPGTYAWRVASFDGILQSDWSVAADITVP